ncbi:MAG TPA: hypothetical protein PLF25_12105, partial [Accumulibacter sp.]|nr:hypothetical protein [Accumulibacter sp.]
MPMKICFALPTANQWRMAVLGSIFLLMADSPVCAVESTLGRLFFSAERRQQLDRQREQNTL